MKRSRWLLGQSSTILAREKSEKLDSQSPHSSLRGLLFLGSGRSPHRFLEGEVAVARRRRPGAVPVSGGQDVVDDVLDVRAGAQQPLESRL